MVEHCVDIAGVASSILATPTIYSPQILATFQTRHRNDLCLVSGSAPAKRSRREGLNLVDNALDYAHRVEEQRPNNISMLYQIGSIYGDKLGGSSEKAYYKKRVRDETRPHATRQKLSRTDPGWRRLELDPMLDDKGNILPDLLKPKYPRPANLPADKEFLDGSTLQYLSNYQPFKYGISALGLAYNYEKRAQILQDEFTCHETQGGHHASRV